MCGRDYYPQFSTLSLCWNYLLILFAMWDFNAQRDLFHKLSSPIELCVFTWLALDEKIWAELTGAFWAKVLRGVVCFQSVLRWSVVRKASQLSPGAKKMWRHRSRLETHCSLKSSLLGWALKQHHPIDTQTCEREKEMCVVLNYCLVVACYKALS